MAEDWSDIEVELIIADYFSMLSDELRNAPINKTHHRNALIKLLNNRSDGSIEFKHQNISAVLIKLELPFIRGYKPRWNFQQILEDKVIEYIIPQKKLIEPTFRQFAENTVNHILKIDFSTVVETAPEKTLVRDPEIKYERKPIKINYLEREQNNTSLGQKGEEFVFEYEKWNFVRQGKQSLSEKIEWISKLDDGAGFDILSKNLNGTDKYIEVKTTKLSKDAPIFFSKNEYEFSKKKCGDYNLYRVFNFSENPKMFFLNGDFDTFCSKDPIQFKGVF